MRTTAGVLMALAFLGVAAPRTTSAQVFFDNYCVTSFNVCASVRVFASGNNLTIQWSPTGGTLEVSPVLGPGAWTSAGTTNPATITIGAQNAYYRIRK